jgi:sulfur carrier protein
MKVLLRHPCREKEIQGPVTVKQLLQKMSILAESVLVIRGSELLLTSDQLEDDDEIELRPVISGG